jgi:hypothetical protein
MKAGAGLSELNCGGLGVFLTEKQKMEKSELSLLSFGLISSKKKMDLSAPGFKVLRQAL